jgi:hypothetical protein
VDARRRKLEKEGRTFLRRQLEQKRLRSGASSARSSFESHATAPAAARENAAARQAASSSSALGSRAPAFGNSSSGQPELTSSGLARLKSFPLVDVPASIASADSRSSSFSEQPAGDIMSSWVS